MTPVSRIMLNPEDEEKIWNSFVGELGKLTDVSKFSAIMKLLLSDSEKLMLSKRMVVFVMADAGATDTQIAKTLHMTRITVSRLKWKYLYSKERKDLAVEIVRSPAFKELIKPWLKKVLIEYALPAAFGKIPKQSIL